MKINLIKRILDIVFSLIILVPLLPIMLVLFLLIILDLKTFPIFTQERNGVKQTRFTIFKFTTMKVKEDGINQFQQALPDDNRVTRFSLFLRKNSIDEILQFFNVLKGDMSIVGPRPHPISLDEEFRKKIPHYMDRYLIKPGITGLAQVSGFRGETDTIEKMKNRVEKDLEYINTQSILLDIKIMYKTLGVLFKGI